MTTRSTRVAVLLSLAALGSPSAWACPDCPAGREARQRVMEHELSTTLLAVVSPLGVIGLVALFAERIGKTRRRGPGRSEAP